MAWFGLIRQGQGLLRWRVLPRRGEPKKVYIMRSALRFLSFGALALMLAPLGVAQNQGSSTSGSNSSGSSAPSTTTPSATSQGTSSGSDGQYLPEKPEKNAPPKDTMDNID